MATELRWTWSRFDDLSLRDLYDALALRCRVFILEQGAYQDPDGLDLRSWHLLGREPGGGLLAYLRVVDPGVKFEEPSIGRVLTAPEIRGGGCGRVLVREGLARCDSTWPGRPNRISAQSRLRPFYQALGFDPASDEYLEDGIPHLQMLRRPQ